MFQLNDFNSLPSNKIAASTKFKALVDNRFNATKLMISVFDRVENNVEKRENAGYQHFLLFPQCFQKLFVSGSLKLGIVWLRVKGLWITLQQSDPYGCFYCPNF